jgi:hypothetical protein
VLPYQHSDENSGGFRQVRSCSRLNSITTALLVSTVALPVSVISFLVLYANNDSFWAVLWLLAVLPTIWVAVAFLIIRDMVKRRSWRQAVAAVTLLVPTALLFGITFTPRFFSHQLFSSAAPKHQPFTFYPPLLFIQKFLVCAKESPCTPYRSVTRTATFFVTKLPEGCCFLQVLNGEDGKHEVGVFHVVLNGRRIDFPHGEPHPGAAVRLNTKNIISIEMQGTPDAYVWVMLSYSGHVDQKP